MKICSFKLKPLFYCTFHWNMNEEPFKTFPHKPLMLYKLTVKLNPVDLFNNT